jgi:hypothetical protein
MRAKDRSNPDSYKVRRAKVGGYRDYFEDDQLADMDALVNSSLSPMFGYRDMDGASAVAPHAPGPEQPARQAAR